MKLRSISIFSFILTVVFLTLFLSSCGPKVEPVSADSIAIYSSDSKVSQADAVMRGLPITVWGIKGSELTSGPFKGWEIYTDGSSLTGLKEYTILPGSSSSIKDFYDNELSDDEWAEGKDVSGDGFSGFSWKRGSQAFAAVIVETNSTCVLITYLLNK